VSVRSLCGHFAMEQAQAFQIELCVDETLINIIEHAFQFESGHAIRLTLAFEPNRILIHTSYHPVRPWSVTAELSDTREPEVDELPERGYGHFLLKSIMDEVRVDFDEEWCHLRIEKEVPGLDPEGEPDAADSE